MLGVDLFVENPIAFAELWARAADMTLDGVAVKVASIPHLIQMKRMAGRAQDIQDVEYLTEILKQSEGKPCWRSAWIRHAKSSRRALTA